MYRINKVRLLLLFLLFFNSIFAIDTVNLQTSRYSKLSIAINNFACSHKSLYSDYLKLNSIIISDLIISGLYNILDNINVIDRKFGISHVPNFAEWKKIKADILVNGEIRKESRNHYKIYFNVWDIILNKLLLSKSFSIQRQDLNLGSHIIANHIYELLTGAKGYFDSKIAYISEVYSRKKKIKRLAVMNFDGTNNQFLTDGKNIVLNPEFSSDGKKILYVSYAKKMPQVFLKHLYTGEEVIIGNFPGMSFAPQFSPDDKKIIFSVAKKGATNLFQMDIATQNITKITNNFSINTSPSYSPDGEQIVMNSDYGGSTQIYIMNKDGSNKHRISFGGGSYREPSWSPRGDYILFTKIEKGEGFMIGIMKPDGSGEKILTKGFQVEKPAWCPNGRVIIFTKLKVNSKIGLHEPYLYTIDISVFNERLIPTPKAASHAAWAY